LLALLFLSCTGLGCSLDPTAVPIRDPPPVSTSPGAEGAVPWVNVFIGTADSDAPHPVTNGAAGSTFPGAALPFGMVQWGPDTPGAAPPGYAYADSQVTGFSLTHLNGAGCSAERDFPFFPLLGDWDPATEPGDGFSHDREIASPGFYEVTLDSGIRVDLTASQRTGLARFTFPSVLGEKILMSGGWRRDALLVNHVEATIAGDDLITGWRENIFFCGANHAYKVYFAARFDRPFVERGTWGQGQKNPGATTLSGSEGGVYVGFDASSHAVQVKVGLSYVSAENALANLDAESPGWDFDAVHQDAIEGWNGYLNRIAIEGGTDGERTSFYSALYHVLLQPAVASDVNGQFIGFDGQVKTANGYVRYANFSGWDIYRSWVQLAAVVAPEQTSDMMRSLVESGTECGALPKWPLANQESSVMVGDPASALLASAYAFGARGFDANAALALMRKGATEVGASCNDKPVRRGLADYLARHYCPADGSDAPRGPAATTLEYAIADFAIALFAQSLGDAATHTEFLDRGRYWTNLFDPAVQANGFQGYVQPRLAADANGMPVFAPVDVGKNEGFVEGNATQYTWMVPHDPYGLIAALGGDAQAIARLDAFFTELNAGMDRPHLYIGNEPGFGTPWLYPFAGAPWRTQDVVRRVLTEAFAPSPEGLPGNDDLGATSSWQVWAMLGLYPAVPGAGGFVLASPLFPKATITLAGGGKLVLVGTNASAEAKYVQSLSVDGQPSTRTWLPWDSVAGGATLEFVLGTTPNQAWGTNSTDKPPSFYP
jgi:predicted alpha-1,2-mannosidase